ncbi:MAG TPA: RNA polymerase sigma factor [Thiotrichales bacterium]|nr:RNA polymerase sigma factor [Thiotrichales bacterium]
MSVLSFFCRAREFRQRLEASRDRLYRVAYSWCHEPWLADDLVQLTLEKALSRSAQLRELEKLDGWLFSILHHCWMDHLRRNRPMVDIDEIPQVEEITPQDVCHESEIIDRVRQAVAGLPIGQRQVLTLVDLEGFSYNEVAAILDIPVGTVMSRLNRARRALMAPLLDLKPHIRLVKVK